MVFNKHIYWKLTNWNIEQISKNLILKNGIWYSKNKSNISYPKDGNENCFQLEENSFWFNHRNNCIIETIKKFSPDGSFYDIGGGNGIVTSALEKNGFDAVLIEPGIQGALNAKKRNIKNIICSTLEDAQFENNSLDAIGLFDVLEHIQKDDLFLQRIYSLLKNNGLLFITVPAHNILWSEEDNNAQHFRRYNLKKLNMLLNKQNFKIQYSTYIFSILPLPIFLFRTIPYRLRIKKSKIKTNNEHQIQSNLLNKIFRFELSKIRKKKKILTGGSCLIVAQK